MSIEAIAWALNTAPIPTGRRDASSLAIVLVGLANHAGPDGRNAFPAVATLVRYTRLSERSVHYALRALAELGLITLADPDIVAAHIKRADRRPKGWDLALTISDPGHTSKETFVHNPDAEVQPLHPDHTHGVQTRPHGVQTTTSRGATTAPEPSQNHPRTIPRTRTRAHDTGRATRPVARPHPPVLPPLCGQCDARPGDPASARIIWLDPDRHHSQPCPRCHPATTTSPAAQDDQHTPAAITAPDHSAQADTPAHTHRGLS